MAIRLKQSTASQEIPLGVFVDETDGKTAETGLTIANTDIKLWKTGATTLADKNSGGATHIAGGIYYAVLDATDTATLGPMVVFVHVSGALPVRVECDVVAADTWDLEFGTDGAKKIGVLAYGTAQSGANLSITLAAATSFTDDYLNGAVVVITGGTGAGQSRVITDWDSASDTAAVDTWKTNPDNTSTYVILAAPPASSTSIPDVNIAKISRDATAADNLEAACDGNTYNVGGGAVVAASVTGAVGSVASGGLTAASFADGAIALQKNVALAKFPFVMRDSTNHAPAEGLTVTATRSIDGGAFGGGTLSAVTEVASGVYYVDFGAGDLNGATIVLKCTAAASDTTFVTIVTNP